MDSSSLLLLSLLNAICQSSESLFKAFELHNQSLKNLLTERREGIMNRWIVLILIASLFIYSHSFGATLNLRATWTANTESDMKEYRLYRTDGTRTLIGTIPHPTTSYNFSVTVPDQSAGTLTFVLTAVDTNNNESLDSSPATYSYNLDTIPPAAPRHLSVQKQ